MKIIVSATLFVLLMVGFIPQSYAPEPFKFKICIEVYPNDNTQLDERLESFLRRELRALGDVSLILSDSNWDFLISYDICEIVFKSDGTKTGELSIASAGLRRVALGYDPKVDFLSSVYGKPGYMLGPDASFKSADDLHEYAIVNIGAFDKQILEPLRRK